MKMRVNNAAYTSVVTVGVHELCLTPYICIGGGNMNKNQFSVNIVS